jgi:hypothetical protein
MRRGEELPPPDVWVIDDEFAPLVQALQPFGLTVDPLSSAQPGAVDLIGPMLDEVQSAANADEVMALSCASMFVATDDPVFAPVACVSACEGAFREHFDAVRADSDRLIAARGPAVEDEELPIDEREIAEAPDANPDAEPAAEPTPDDVPDEPPGDAEDIGVDLPSDLADAEFAAGAPQDAPEEPAGTEPEAGAAAAEQGNQLLLIPDDFCRALGG